MNLNKNEPLDDENLYEDWLKSIQSSPGKELSIRTVEVNSAMQSYQDMFKNIEIIELRESKESFKPIENNKPSSNSGSFLSPQEKSASVRAIRDLNRTCYDSVVEHQQEAEEVAKIYCSACKRYCYPKISLQLRDLSAWGNFKYFLKSFKCCNAVNEMKEFHEYAYICSFCRKIVVQKPAVFK